MTHDAAKRTSILLMLALTVAACGDIPMATTEEGSSETIGDAERSEGTLAMTTPGPTCRFQSDNVNVAWVYTDPATPERAGRHPPDAVYIMPIERSLKWGSENEAYPFVLRADCDDLRPTGSEAWIELRPLNPSDEWFKYVKVHPSEQVGNAWFFTWWHEWAPDPPVGVIAELYTGIRPSTKTFQQRVLVGVTDDAADEHGSYFCTACRIDEGTGDLICEDVANFCPIP